jgi:hypothetical protein
MSTDAQDVQRGRRTFLKGLVLAGGATVLVPLAATSARGASAGPKQQEPPAQSRGYHVTKHISTYYEKAAF